MGRFWWGLSICLVAWIATPRVDIAVAEASTRRVAITLRDGTVVHGTVLSETDRSIEIATDSLGTLVIDVADVRSMTDVDPARTMFRRDPDVNSVLFVPTSETLPQGDVYYRNFEILFNNFGYALTDDVALSAMFAFPITGDLQIGSIGVKARLLSRETHPVGLAAVAGATFVSDERATNVGAILSVGDARRGLSVVASLNFAGGEEVTVILVGGDVQVSRTIKLIAEYGNAADAVFDDADFSGLINVGFRAFWGSGSFTLSALRPVDDSGGDLFAVPFGQVSLHF